MTPLRAFCSGLAMRHVDYSTRHHSRAYDAGVHTTMVLIFALPVAVIFGLGVLTGVYIR